MQSWSQTDEAEEFRRLAFESRVTLDRLFVLCRATDTPLTLDFAPARESHHLHPEVYVRVGGIGVGWFDDDGIELTGAVAEWIGALETRMRDASGA